MCSVASRRAASSAIDTSEPVAIRRDDEIGAARDAVSAADITAEGRQRLPRQAQHGGTMLGLECAVPGLQRLDRVSRTKHQKIGNHAECRKMLDRLVRRA